MEKNISVKTCVRVGVTAVLVYLCIHYCDRVFGVGKALLGAMSPLIVGFVIAYMINILMTFYEHKLPLEKVKHGDKLERPVCMLFAMLTVAGIMYMVVYLVIPELFRCINLLIAEIPPAIEACISWLRENDVLEYSLVREALDTLAAIDWQEKIGQMVQVVFEGFGGAAQMAMSTVTGLVGGVTNFIISLIFAIFLLTGKARLLDQLGRFADRYIDPVICKKARYVLGTANYCFHKFIVGQCVEAVVLGAMCIVGMSVLQFPYAVMVGTLIGFTALIPIAGGYIGAGIGAFMIMTVSPMQALGFLVFILILQQIEGNLIYPKVVGSSIGLPGVWVLAAVTIGGGLYGIVGMLIGVPLAATAYTLLKVDMRGKTPKFKEAEAAEE